MHIASPRRLLLLFPALCAVMFLSALPCPGWGACAAGSCADVTLLDPCIEPALEVPNGGHLCDNSPFVLELRFSGRAPFTFVHTIDGVEQPPITTNDTVFNFFVGGGAYQDSVVITRVRSDTCEGVITGLPFIRVIPPLSATAPQVNCDAASLTYTVSFQVSGGFGNYVPVAGTSGFVNGALFTSTPVSFSQGYDLRISFSLGCDTLVVQGVSGCGVPCPPLGIQAAGNSPLCTRDTLRLTASGGPGLSYAWTGPGGFSSNIQNPVVNNVALSAEGVYKVVAIDAAGCRDSAQVSVLVRPSPVLQLADTTFFCPGEDIVVVATGGSGALQYAIFGDPFQSSNNLGPRVSGSFSVLVRDAAGCGDVAFILVRNGPRITDVQTTPVSCRTPRGSITVIASGAPPLGYSIHTRPGFQPDRTFFDLAPGAYTITVRDTNGCLANRNAVIAQLPALSITGVETMPAACGNANGSLSIQTAGGTAPLAFAIDKDSLPQSGSFFANLRPGAYTVEARDNAGCVAVQTATVSNAPCEFYVPNAFSPNGDGINDVLQVYGDEVLTSAVVRLYQVFDRWGGLAYEAKDFPFLSTDRWWDGTVKGRLAPAGVYAWYVVVAVNAEEIIKLNGEVNLMR